MKKLICILLLIIFSFINCSFINKQIKKTKSNSKYYLLIYPLIGYGVKYFKCNKIEFLDNGMFRCFTNDGSLYFKDNFLIKEEIIK